MKRKIKMLIIVIFLYNMMTTVYAQSDVTRFLGIPVDGNKSELKAKLKSKGFTINQANKDFLEGEFNGRKVGLVIGTTNNKVYRVMVTYKNRMTEGDIKIEFNRLCDQFKNNKKYISLSDDVIAETEDISYEMNVNQKRYQAVFYQLPENADSNIIVNECEAALLGKYSKEQMSNSTEELRKEMLETCVEHLRAKFSKKTVWFMINEEFGKFYITIYYDNELNRASGDDL